MRKRVARRPAASCESSTTWPTERCSCSNSCRDTSMSGTLACAISISRASEYIHSSYPDGFTRRSVTAARSRSPARRPMLLTMSDLPPLLIPAGNPSEWTGPTGNNTWLIRGREPALVDAGTGLAEHVDAVAQALDGAALARVLITHWHPDHVSGLPALKKRWKQLVVVESGSTP